MTLPGGYETDLVVRLEANLDDISGELLGAVMQKLFTKGALDVWFTPIQMKKQRPGVLLSVLCEPPLLERMTEIVFAETTTFGVRVSEEQRLKLSRKFVVVQTAYGAVSVKVGLRGEQVLQIAPEFENCRAVSEASGKPLHVIYEAARMAFRDMAE